MTSLPLTTNTSSVCSADIQRHYDRLSSLYGWFWGRHIHHGYWRGNESVEMAQIQLMEELLKVSRIPIGAKVLDVGSGLGGSALWLARYRGCRVHGITISPVQAKAASKEAQRQGLAHMVTFEIMDADKLKFKDGSFDAIWTIECSEHLFDKSGFFNRCYEILRPDGVIAVCAWLKGERMESPENQNLLDDIRNAMLCPTFGSLEDYAGWLVQAGFERIHASNITSHVMPTWDRCIEISRRPDVRLISALSAKPVRDFVKSFHWMKKAFLERAMAYGLFTARRG